MRDRLKILARRLGEGFLVFVLCVMALRFVYPTAVSRADSHVWAYSEDPYAQGDLNGALYMVQRSALGETGCEATTHGHPWTWNICQEIPNPVVTDLLGGFVRVLGMPLGYNFGILFFLATNGLAVYIVTRLAGARAPPALFVALAATTAPPLISEVEGGFVQHSWWAPALLATGLSVAAIPSWKRFWLIVPGAFCLAWSIPVYAMMPFKLLPWTLAAGLVAVLSGEDRKGRVVRAALGLVVAGLFVSPLLASGMDSAGPRLFPGPATADNLMLGLMDFEPGDFFATSFHAGEFNRIPMVLSLTALVSMLIAWRHWRVWAPAMGAAWLLLWISLGPSIGGGAFNSNLPYVWMMEHIELARGSMRPVRYGIAGMFLLCIATGLALSVCWTRFGGAHWKKMGAGLLVLAWVLLLQVRPRSMTPDLAWPPFESLSALEEGVQIDVPLSGENERRFGLWAYHPAPRMNPPHDRSQWEDRIRVSEGAFPLIELLQEAGKKDFAMTEEQLSGLEKEWPEVQTHGLRHILVHRSLLSAEKVQRYRTLLPALGATWRGEADGVIRYSFGPLSESF